MKHPAGQTFPNFTMSVAGQEQAASSGSSDILSQALFQTGLSTPVKTENEDPAFELPEEHLFSCDVQTLTNSLISKMDDSPVQLPSLGIEQDAFSVLGNQNSLQENLYPRTQAMPQLAGGGGVATSASNGNAGYSGNGGFSGGVVMPKLKKLENGLVPTSFSQQQHQTFPMTTQPVVSASPVTPHPPPLQQPPQSDVFTTPGESSSNGFSASNGIDNIELEDLLAIDVTENEPAQPAINMYTSSSNTPSTLPGANSGYSLSGPSTSQSLYPAQNLYNSYQQPPVSSQPEMSSQLPDLMSEDLFDFLGEDSSLLDNDLPSQSDISYSSTFPSSGLQHQVQSSYHGRPPMPPPYGANSSMSNFVNTTAHPGSSAGALTGFNIRQHQQVGGSGSGSGLFSQRGVMSRGSQPGQPNRGSQPVRFPARQPVVSMVGGSLVRPPIAEPVGHVSAVTQPSFCECLNKNCMQCWLKNIPVVFALYNAHNLVPFQAHLNPCYWSPLSIF